MSDIELEEGESILWQGTPQQPVGARHWWFLYVVACAAGFPVLWSLLYPAPEGMASLHEFVSVPFCRAILGFMSLFASLGPR